MSMFKGAKKKRDGVLWCRQFHFSECRAKREREKNKTKTRKQKEASDVDPSTQETYAGF